MIKRKLPLLLSFLILFSVECIKFEYPDIRRDLNSKYERFGNEILDPYQWLEDSKSEDTKKFVKLQNNVTNSYIRTNSNYEQIKQDFKKLYNYTTYGIPSKHGDYYYQFIQKPLQNQAILYRMKSLDEENPQIFFDPNILSEDGTTSLSFIKFSKDGKWAAYATSVGGSDWNTIRVKNVETGQDLNDVLTKTKFSSVSWNINSQGFFYAYYDTYNGTGDGTETEVPKFQKLYYHRLNTTQKDDIKIVGFDEHPQWLVGTAVISEDGKKIHVFPAPGTSNMPWLYAKIDPENIDNKTINFEWIVKDLDAEYHYIGDDEECTYIRTNYKAKNFRVVCVDLSKPDRENWKNIIENDNEHTLADTFIVNKNYIVATYMINVVNVLQIHDLKTGKHLFDVDTPIGTIFATADQQDSTEFFYKITSFLTPGIIYHYDFKSFVIKPTDSTYTNKIKVLKESVIDGLDMSKFETKQYFYTSKDGTKVPIFITCHKDLKKNKLNPTWLNAYGGFNIPIQPSYNLMAMFFAGNLNGVFALANIRGGGEYGDDWHVQGMRLNKQNVFDDFASAGEWLIKEGYTSPSYLTINGRSNGGLLAGTSSNQRPDIFGSAIAEVGVMDMLKFPLFTIGYAWIEEYGDPIKNETEFNYIKKYSPLHNIREDMDKYPNMLVLTADHDDRVVPAHSYKFISELQFKLGKKLNTPLMIRIDSNSGHGAGKPISKWIEQYTDIVCFLLNSTPYKYVPTLFV